MNLTLWPGLYPEIASGVLAAVLPARSSLAVGLATRSLLVGGISRPALVWSLVRYRMRHALRARALSWAASGGDPMIEDQWSREVLHAEHAAALLTLALRGRVAS